MTEQERKDYIAFMYNKDNEYHCADCPENIQSRVLLPCGQQNCWVTCHVKWEERAEDNE